MNLNCRHAAYVPSPDTEGLNRYLLTLLAQRRELCCETFKNQLHGDTHVATGTSAAALYSNISSSAIDAERRDLQRELTLGLEFTPQVPVTDRLRQALTCAGGGPLRGAVIGVRLPFI